MEASLRIRSRLPELRHVRNWLAGFLESEMTAPADQNHLLVAVTEALTNIISHGYRGEEHHEIVITLSTTSERLEVAVRDSGVPFDPRTLPPLDPIELREGGRGLFLMNRFVDRLEYESGPENVLRLIKFKHGAPSSAA